MVSSAPVKMPSDSRFRAALRPHGQALLVLLFAILGCFFALACEGCRPSSTPGGDATSSPTEAPKARLYLVSDLAGALEPCGCVKDQLGGMDRFGALVAAEKDKAPAYATLSAGPRIGIVVHPVRDGRPVVMTEAGPTIVEGRAGGRVRGAAEALLSTPAHHHADDAHGELLDALGSPLGRLLDRRVRVVLDTLAFEPEPPTLEMLSARTELSSERLRHLVVESLGVGLRRLLQWYRFTSALTRMWRPERLAHIAAETGFSDQAHLARTTRELIGHPPSLRTAIEWRIHGNYHSR